MNGWSLRALAILPLLFAVLSAGLAPHLHTHVGHSDAAALERGSGTAGSTTPSGIDGVECLACRVGQSKRLLAIVPEATRFELADARPEGIPLLAPAVVERWLRSAVAPRAPPA